MIQPGPFGILFLFLFTMGYTLLFNEMAKAATHGRDMGLDGYLYAVLFGVATYYILRIALYLMNPINWIRFIVWLANRP
jgi:hypothetical protein